LPKTQLQPLQRVDEAEPPHERLLGASVRAEVPSDRLAVELDLEPDAERVIGVGDWSTVGRRVRRLRRGGP
jgi:hypothetical protein